MTKYEIYEGYAEIKYNEREEIKSGCSLTFETEKKIKEFASLEEAKESFKKYKTDISKYDRFFAVTEYAIYKVTYDDDMNCLEKECLDITDMKFEIIEKQNSSVVETFDTYDEAEDALSYYDDIDLYCICCGGDVL